MCKFFVYQFWVNPKLQTTSSYYAAQEHWLSRKRFAGVETSSRSPFRNSSGINGEVSTDKDMLVIKEQLCDLSSQKMIN